MVGKFVVRKTRNAINALWSSSVITASLSFDFFHRRRALSKKRSKRDLSCTILFQDCEPSLVVNTATVATNQSTKVLIKGQLRLLERRLFAKNMAMVCSLH